MSFVWGVQVDSRKNADEPVLVNLSHVMWVIKKNKPERDMFAAWEYNGYGNIRVCLYECFKPETESGDFLCCVYEV